jgi:hypothetical protein
LRLSIRNSRADSRPRIYLANGIVLLCALRLVESAWHLLSPEFPEKTLWVSRSFVGGKGTTCLGCEIRLYDIVVTKFDCSRCSWQTMSRGCAKEDLPLFTPATRPKRNSKLTKPFNAELNPLDLSFFPFLAYSSNPYGQRTWPTSNMRDSDSRLRNQILGGIFMNRSAGGIALWLLVVLILNRPARCLLNDHLI